MRTRERVGNYRRNLAPIRTPPKGRPMRVIDWFAGIDEHDDCTCGQEARHHYVRILKGKVTHRWCETNIFCKGFVRAIDQMR